MAFHSWKPYVSVADRKRQAEREVQRLAKKGRSVTPVVVEGRVIASSFWGKSWCQNLEHYSDYASRLPRGRSYLRNGSVVDLQIAPGEVSAMVSGSSLYTVTISVEALDAGRWSALGEHCAGAIDSLVDLLQGRLSKAIMARVCDPESGLFPAPDEIELDCSCPDSASMCKHIAAVLYGIGARLDHEPHLLFTLRRVDEKELVARASQGTKLGARQPKPSKILRHGGMAELFGIDLALELPAPEEATAPTVAKKAGAKKTGAKKTAAARSAVTKTRRR